MMPQLLNDKSLCNTNSNFMVHAFGRTGSWLLMYHLLENNNTLTRQTTEGDYIWEALSPIQGIPKFRNNHDAFVKELQNINLNGMQWIIKTTDQVDFNKLKLKDQFKTPTTEIFMFRSNLTEQVASFIVALMLGKFHIEKENTVNLFLLDQVSDEIIIEWINNCYRAVVWHLSFLLQRKRLNEHCVIVEYNDMLENLKKYFYCVNPDFNPYHKTPYENDIEPYNKLKERISSFISSSELDSLNALSKEYFNFTK